MTFSSGRECLRAYAQVLLARSSWTGAALVCATALAPRALCFGLAAVMVASLLARAWHLDRGAVADGVYGYNALLVGLGVGQSFAGIMPAFPLAMVGAAATVVVTAALRSWMGRIFQLPVLSLPFLIVYALVTWTAPVLQLEHQAAAVADGALAAQLPDFACTLLRDLGAIFFLPSADAGAFVLLALLVHSRIATVLATTTAAAVVAFGAAFPAALDAFTLQMIAGNGLLVAVAVGGVWFVPSLAAAAWALGAVVLSTLLTLGTAAPLLRLGISPMFVPFNLTALCILLAARERTRDGAPKSVDFIPGTPEENLSFFRTRLARFQSRYGIRFHLPGRGRWTCTQAVDGEHTHQGPWRHAFDFEVMGPEGKPFTGDGYSVADYHCYRLPVLATAAGTVVKVVNAIADNEIGEMNLKQNWGNLVMLAHGPALFSLVAHLAPGSCKVREGQTVSRGDVLGLCGSSGRSPIPHVHFQLQSSQVLGADTLPVAFNDAVRVPEIGERLESSLVPKKGTVARNLEPVEELRSLFNFHDGDVWSFRLGQSVERLTCGVDLHGQMNLRSNDRSACMVFENADDILVCYDATGDRSSVLQLLRAAMPRVPLEDNARIAWRDFVPVHAVTTRFSLARLTAPFLATGGLEVEYRMTRQGSRWVLTGESVERERSGAAVLRTCVELEQGAGPLTVEVTSRGFARKARRVLAEVTELTGQPPLSRRTYERDAHRIADSGLLPAASLPVDPGSRGITDGRPHPLSGVL